MTQSKLLGSTLIIAGTTIGAGMLALPLASIEYWLLNLIDDYARLVDADGIYCIADGRNPPVRG